MRNIDSRWNNISSRYSKPTDDRLSDFEFRVSRLHGAIRKAREMGEEVPEQYKRYSVNPASVSDDDVEDFINTMSKKYKDYNTAAKTDTKVNKPTVSKPEVADDDIVMIPDEGEDTDVINEPTDSDTEDISDPIDYVLNLPSREEGDYSDYDAFFDDNIECNPSIFNEQNYDMECLSQKRRMIHRCYQKKLDDSMLKMSYNEFSHRPNPDPILLEVLETIPGCECRVDYHTLLAK